MRWRLGTMGFSYGDWAGVFYPRGLKNVDWLAHYARHFNAVELDTTFHALPDRDRVRRWGDATPPDFRFAAKTPKGITHESHLATRCTHQLRMADGRLYQPVVAGQRPRAVSGADVA